MSLLRVPLQRLARNPARVRDKRGPRPNSRAPVACLALSPHQMRSTSAQKTHYSLREPQLCWMTALDAGDHWGTLWPGGEECWVMPGWRRVRQDREPPWPGREPRAPSHVHHHALERADLPPTATHVKSGEIAPGCTWLLATNKPTRAINAQPSVAREVR